MNRTRYNWLIWQDLQTIKKQKKHKHIVKNKRNYKGMKKPNRFTVCITDPRGIKSIEETTFLNTTYYLLLEQKGYNVQIWEDTRYKARERLYRIKTGKKKSVYSVFDGAILNF